MNTLLSLRMEDVGGSNFTATVRNNALNVGQRILCNYLDESYLSELEFRDVITVDSQGINSGMVQLSGDGSFGTTMNKSTHKPIRNNIQNVQIKVGTTYRYAIHMDFKDVKKIENDYLGADEENPLFWVFGPNIHIRPMTGASQVVLYYIKSPATISDAQNCELNESLHEIVVDLAENELWRQDNNSKRGEIARANAMDHIKVLNARLKVEGPDELE